MLSAKNLVCGYATELVKVESLELIQGEISVVLGPNGSGKSTLLHTLAGFCKSLSGEVSWNATPLANQQPLKRASEICLLVQEPGGDYPISVRSVVEMGTYHRQSGIVSRFIESENQIIHQAMELMDISDFSERMLNELSGGERQRVHLARVWAQNSITWLLDEPTNHLDIRHQLSLAKQLLLQAKQGKSILLTTHHLELAQSIATRIGVIDDGQLKWIWHNSVPNDISELKQTLVRVFEANMCLLDSGKLAPAWE